MEDKISVHSGLLLSVTLLGLGGPVFPGASELSWDVLPDCNLACLDQVSVNFLSLGLGLGIRLMDLERVSNRKSMNPGKSLVAHPSSSRVS